MHLMMLINLPMRKYLSDNKVYYAEHPGQKEKRKDWWHDWPEQEMGSHTGIPDIQ
jgi:hypothetical protein